MKPIALLLLISVTLVPFSALALSARTVSIEEAQGINGAVITLEVAPGYGLNINLIPTGEVVKKAWIDDPSRITLSFDGNLCQGASSPEQQCNNEGATVIHLRQIQPIQFPNLPRSAGGGTLLTLITESSQGRKIYLFKIVPISGTPKYTVLNVSSDTPANTPLLRGRNAPLMVNNNVQRRQVQNYVQPQSAVRAYERRNTPRRPQLEQPSTTTGVEFAEQQSMATIQPNESIPTAPFSTPTLPSMTYIKPTPIAPFSLPKTPIPVDNKLAPTAIITDSKTASASNNKLKQTVAISTAKTPLPLNSTPIKPTAATPASEVSPSSNSAMSTSIEQANALVRGLVIARQKGEINHRTKVWKQVQSVVFLLRRGATAQEATKKVGVSLQLVEQLIAWGNNSTLSTLTSSN